MEQKHQCNQTERVLTLEITSRQMVADIGEIKKEVNEIGIAQRNNHEAILAKFDGLDVKYAKKESVSRLWIIVWSIIGFVFTALGTAIMVLLLNK